MPRNQHDEKDGVRRKGTPRTALVHKAKNKASVTGSRVSRHPVVVCHLLVRYGSRSWPNVARQRRTVSASASSYARS